MAPSTKGALATDRMWVIMRAGDCDGGQAVESGEAKCEAPKRCPLVPSGSIVDFRMTTDSRELMEARGAGESCPTFPKTVPDDPMFEGKFRAALVRTIPHLTAPARPPEGGRGLWGDVIGAECYGIPESC